MRKRDWRSALTEAERGQLAVLELQIHAVLKALVDQKRKRSRIVSGPYRDKIEKTPPILALDADIAALQRRKLHLSAEQHRIRNRGSARSALPSYRAKAKAEQRAA